MYNNDNVILEEYLQNLENKSKNSELKDKYLWPRTPDTETHQDKILQRVGATDYEIHNPISRTYKVIKQLKDMIKKRAGGGGYVLFSGYNLWRCNYFNSIKKNVS